MTIVEVAKIAQPFQRVVRTSWDKPYRFWYLFNANGCMKAAGKRPDLLALFQHDFMATDWAVIEEDEIAEELRAPVKEIAA